MKTKHLFYAAGMAALMAACTNEDIVLDSPQMSWTGERAVVENVQLDFNSGVDSRLTYDGQYAWEATDVIGALLMDRPTGVTTDWSTKYELVNDINTSYPFAYDAEEGTWSCPGKMLEGNYFFAFPWSNYEGERRVNHSLFNQAQNGVGASAVAQSFADNQFFIGYAQIEAGTQTNETLENVVMADVLGGIQLRMVNNTGKTLHVYKVVLDGAYGAVTFEPATASYDSETGFNYAKYIGDEDYVAATANKHDALRAVAKGVSGVAQLMVNGTDAERAIPAGSTGYAVIMSAPFKVADLVDPVSIKVYTDEGYVNAVSTFASLNDINGNPVEKVAPGVKTTLQVGIAPGDLQATTEMSVYTEQDLLKLIQWNLNKNTTTPLIATLEKDVTMTKEIFDALKSNTNLTLSITGNGKVLTLAADLPNNVLDYAKLTIAGTSKVIAKGTIVASAKTSAKAATLEIAKGATLNINTEAVGGVDGMTLPIINNYGNVNIAAVKVTAAGAFTNYAKNGVVTVATGADVKIAMTNFGVINNNGYMDGSVTNKAKAVINLGAVSTQLNVTNEAEATINAAANSQITCTSNAGLIKCADNTVSVPDGTSGKVAIPATGTIAKDAYKDSGFNTLILTGETTFSDTQADIVNIIAEDGAIIKVANGKALSLTSLEVNGAVSIITNTTTGDNGSSLTFTNATINKGAVLTNNGVLKVTGTVVGSSWKNEGQVINNQEIWFAPAIFSATTKYGKWQYKQPKEIQAGPDYGTEDDVTIDFNASVGTLKKLAAKITANVDGNDEVELINVMAPIDMSVEDNYNYVSALNYDVVLSANITNLKNSHALTMGKLTINSDITIEGTMNMVVIKVDEIVFAPAADATIQGLIEVDEVAVEGMGSEKVTVPSDASFTAGAIVAKNAAGKYLKWDNSTSTWMTR